MNQLRFLCLALISLCFLSCRARRSHLSEIKIQSLEKYNPLVTAFSGSQLLKGGMVLVEGEFTQTDILVREGIIVEVAPDLTDIDDINRIENVKGKYIVPGLIDGHVHLQNVPGLAYRIDQSPQGLSPQLRALAAQEQRQQLAAYLASGVTSVLDAFAEEGALDGQLAYLKNKGVGPRVWRLSPMITPQHGYMTKDEFRAPLVRANNPELGVPTPEPTQQNMKPGSEFRREIANVIEQSKDQNPLGIKVFLEDGFSNAVNWPQFKSSHLRAIKEVAGDIPFFVHSMEPDTHLLALETLGPKAFLHGGFDIAVDRETTVEIAQKMAKQEVIAVSTIGVFDMPMLLWDKSLRDSPLWHKTVPEGQKKTLEDSENGKFQRFQMVDAQSLPVFAGRVFSRNFFSKKSFQKKRLNMARSLKTFADNGVTIAMGSDAGNWPMFSSVFHGFSSVREWEGLIEFAKFPPKEALKIATENGAKLLGQEKLLGKIQPNFMADLVVLNSNPFINQKAFRDIAYTMIGGVMKSPDDWLKESLGASPKFNH